jgi:hypothetical protein
MGKNIVVPLKEYVVGNGLQLRNAKITAAKKSRKRKTIFSHLEYRSAFIFIDRCKGPCFSNLKQRPQFYALNMTSYCVNTVTGKFPK